MLKTIRTFKEMNLQELIDYIIKNEIKGETFNCKDGGEVYVNCHGGINVKNIFPENRFVIEVEEEISEKTVFHHLIEVDTDNDVFRHVTENIESARNSHSKQFYTIINGRLELIWECDEE